MLISAVKLADDRSGDLIVRLYESAGGRTTTRLVMDLPAVESVHEADLLERPGEPVAWSAADGVHASVVLEFRPFQLRTLRITPGRTS